MTTIEVKLPAAVVEAFLRVAPTDPARQLFDFNDLALGRIQMREALAAAGVEPETVRPGHPRWEEFAERLGGPEACDFKKVKGKTTWQCGGGTDLSKSEAILRDMFGSGSGAQIVQRSLTYFSANGGHCDCEVLFNVDEAPDG